MANRRRDRSRGDPAPAALQPCFDWALNDECLPYDGCGALTAFTNAGKGVVHVAYSGSIGWICSQTAPLPLSSQLENLDLDAWFQACWERHGRRAGRRPWICPSR